MRKLLYFLMILTVIFTSCENDETVTPDETAGVNDGIMTLADFHGRWFFVSYLYDGITWTEESDIPNAYKDIEDRFNDWFFDTATMTATWSEDGYPYIIRKTGDIVTLSDAMNVVFKFTILSYHYNTTTSRYNMTLRYEDTGTSFYDYKGGVYTFTR